MTQIFVTKATGEKEPFDEEKLRSSIGRAGIGRDLADEVVGHVKRVLYPGISTREVYRHILEFLGKSPEPHARTRYSLKQAIMELGPSGFPFEKFVAAVLTEYGYRCQVDQTVEGKCVSHEVDIAAQKDGRKILIECKFHNSSGSRSDVKVALYVQARFTDLAGKFDEVWLVTNTKCTSDAIQYALCAGLKIVAWGYPEKGNLQTLVESRGLLPVTALTSLSRGEKQHLLDRGLVLFKQIIQSPADLAPLHLSTARQSKLLAEVRGAIGQLT